MYEGLRLTELHEEWAWQSSRADALGNGHPNGQQAYRATAGALDAEIRARVAMIPPGLIEPLRFGVPDARRNYRQRYFSDWTNHELHAVPVEGCHLCREGRR